VSVVGGDQPVGRGHFGTARNHCDGKGNRPLGLGLQLMTRLERAALARDLHVLVAAISAANPGAVAFHARLGFDRVAHMPQVGRKAGQWLDLILMQKILPRSTDSAGQSG